MFCKKCGKEIKEGVRFCPYCGAESGVSNEMKATEKKEKRNQNKGEGRCSVKNVGKRSKRV